MKMVEIGKDKYDKGAVLEAKFDAEDHEIEETDSKRERKYKKGNEKNSKD